MLKWRFERGPSMRESSTDLATTLAGPQCAFSALSSNMASDGKLTDYGFLEPRGRPLRQLQKPQSTQTHSLPRGFSASKHRSAEPSRAFQDISNSPRYCGQRGGPSGVRYTGQQGGPSSPRYAVRRTLERSVSCVSPDNNKVTRPYLPEPQRFVDQDSGPAPSKALVYELARQHIQRTQSYTQTGGSRQTPVTLGNIPEKSQLRVSNQPQVRSNNFQRNQFPYASASVIPSGSYQRNKDPRRQPFAWSEHIPEDFMFGKQLQQQNFPIYADRRYEAPAQKLCSGPQQDLKETEEDSGVYSKLSNTFTSSTDSIQSVTAKISEPSRDGDYLCYGTGTLSRSHDVKSDLLMGKGILKLSVYLNYGMLTIDVIQARHLQSATREMCNSHVKISLVPDDTRRTKCSTSIVSDTNHPLFEEKFSFELLPGDIKKRVLVSVWNYSELSQYSEFLGCMTFGVESIFSAKRVVDGWYYLLKEDVGRKKHLKAIVKKPVEPRELRAGQESLCAGTELGHVIRNCVSQHLLDEIVGDEPSDASRWSKRSTTGPSFPNRSVSMGNLARTNPRPTRREQQLTGTNPLPTRREQQLTGTNPRPTRRQQQLTRIKTRRYSLLTKEDRQDPLPTRKAKKDIPQAKRNQEDNVYLLPACCVNNRCENNLHGCGNKGMGTGQKSLSAGHMRDLPTTRITRSLSAMNLSSHRGGETPSRGSVGLNGSRKNCSLKQDSFFSIPTPKAQARKVNAPRIVYVDKTKGLSPIPSSKSTNVPHRNTALPPQPVVDCVPEWQDHNNTYESLDFLDDVHVPSKKEGTQSKKTCPKRKRDVNNDSNLSNTSVKHPTKRRKTGGKESDTGSSKAPAGSSVSLPFSRGWRLRDSFRRAIFGKKKSKKFVM